jgi:hypothetical protein
VRPDRPSLTEVLDDAVEIVPLVALPWLGLLWLTAMPLRFLQAHIITRLVELGPEAGRFGDHLAQLAIWATLLFIVSLWGRAVFVRAVHLRLRTHQSPCRAALRLPAPSLACYVYTALAIEVACYASLVTFVSWPVAVLLAGLAAATTPLITRPSLVAPWREVLKAMRGGVALAGLLFVFGAAWLLASANLFFAFQLGLWVAGGLPGLDLSRWDALLSLGNFRFVLVLLAGGGLAVEPFWLAAMTLHVHKLRARASGDDLRLWFDRLRSEAP